ncbi:MAG: dephospho-CoA kinase [Thauera propionica]|jgi:dephospho-CoA kinase|uniref:Dephospho-CoA kinase n=1 Tax=Thauera propionica TaxID=2019431 RepID=A0A235EX14_9RHOO|nr:MULTISPECIES: dephospho-CoA kinase [Thauera]MDY0046467.1 dephospho-CoA kinase [Thauera propionica]OYD53550.1 dephospho-CoA kinase [Thauera propionica]
MHLVKSSARRPFVVGLTGGIGSGKSAVANHFVAQGASLVDTDAIAHALTAAGGAAIPAIRDHFGMSVLAADGSLDRAAMRSLAFSHPEARKQLEAILHPLIRDESARQCLAAQGPYVILAVPLLVESGTYRERCDRVCVVDCPEALQIERVKARSGLAEAQIRAIMAAQASRAARLAVADDVVDNDGTLDQLRVQVERLHRRYIDLAGKRT